MSRRNEENCIPGFNLAVIDIDGTTTLETARLLMGNYKYLLYTTKSHTPDKHCFRMIFPLSHKLKLSAVDYKQFMKNLFEWLPFDVDTATGQRARKWLSNKGHHEYNDGELLDALLFIPRTKKSEIQKKKIHDTRALSNIERWFINNTEEGNRSNQLIKYGFLLVDSGYRIEDIKDKLLALNSKLADGLSESEILSTILISISKKIQQRDN